MPTNVSFSPDRMPDLSGKVIFVTGGETCMDSLSWQNTLTMYQEQPASGPRRYSI